jgi:exonuclease SbcD
MKILHTSDWHLGQVFYTYDRSCEQQYFLKQLAEIAAAEKPDVMLVSGDVYHQSSPAASVQRMYTEAILKIREACPEMAIVVIAGNHDSSSRLEIDSSLWQYVHVSVIGNIEVTDGAINFDKHIIEITRKDGGIAGFIAAVPHTYPHNFPAGDANVRKEERQSEFFQAVLDKVKERNTDNAPVVLMAHLAVSGVETPGRDEAGGMEYVGLNELGEGYDYLALGHIHYPQTLKGSNGRARYSGSPVPVSFDEQYPHSVSIVELAVGEAPVIRAVEIDNMRPCVTLPAKAPVPFDDALKLLQDYPDDSQAYIRLNVEASDYLSPDCNERAVEAAKDKSCRYCYIKISHPDRVLNEEVIQLTIQEMQEASPLDIAKRYYRDTRNEDMDDELCLLIEEAIKSVNHETAETDN